MDNFSDHLEAADALSRELSSIICKSVVPLHSTPTSNGSNSRSRLRLESDASQESDSSKALSLGCSDSGLGSSRAHEGISVALAERDEDLCAALQELSRMRSELQLLQCSENWYKQELRAERNIHLELMAKIYENQRKHILEERRLTCECLRLKNKCEELEAQAPQQAQQTLLAQAAGFELEQQQHNNFALAQLYALVTDQQRMLALLRQQKRRLLEDLELLSQQRSTDTGQLHALLRTLVYKWQEALQKCKRLEAKLMQLNEEQEERGYCQANEQSWQGTFAKLEPTQACIACEQSKFTLELLDLKLKRMHNEQRRDADEIRTLRHKLAKYLLMTQRLSQEVVAARAAVKEVPTPADEADFETETEAQMKSAYDSTLPIDDLHTNCQNVQSVSELENAVSSEKNYEQNCDLLLHDMKSHTLHDTLKQEMQKMPMQQEHIAGVEESANEEQQGTLYQLDKKKLMRANITALNRSSSEKEEDTTGSFEGKQQTVESADRKEETLESDKAERNQEYQETSTKGRNADALRYQLHERQERISMLQQEESHWLELLKNLSALNLQAQPNEDLEQISKQNTDWQGSVKSLEEKLHCFAATSPKNSDGHALKENVGKTARSALKNVPQEHERYLQRLRRLRRQHKQLAAQLQSREKQSYRAKRLAIYIPSIVGAEEMHDLSKSVPNEGTDNGMDTEFAEQLKQLEQNLANARATLQSSKQYTVMQRSDNCYISSDARLPLCLYKSVRHAYVQTDSHVKQLQLDLPELALRAQAASNRPNNDVLYQLIERSYNCQPDLKYLETAIQELGWELQSLLQPQRLATLTGPTLMQELMAVGVHQQELIRRKIANTTPVFRN